ncbi:MAG: ribonuclease HI [Nitrososphaerota archaeon]|nr:ribonuclease HI [Nitrososphaerota archaeon]
MPLDPRAVLIYTDGSCYCNPGGSSGCAAIVQYPEHLGQGDEQIVDFGCSESSNNRMELLACIHALKWIRKNSPWPGVSYVQVVTDSQYVKDNIIRASGWRKNGWRNQFGEPIENRDLWKEFLSSYQRVGTTVRFEWTAGKKTPILKTIDRAAKVAAKRGGQDIDRGFRPGTIAKSLVKGAATRFTANGQSAVIRPYKKTLAGKSENKVRFDVFSEESGVYTQSSYAFASPAVAVELHRQHGYRVRFNDTPNYPQIMEIIEEVAIPNRVKP